MKQFCRFLCKKVQDLYNDYKNKRFFFSRRYSFIFVLSSYITCFAKQKHDAIKKVLCKYCNSDIMLDNQDYGDIIPHNAPIWILWYQGENCMPPIVKICYLSVLNNAVDHPVHLLTAENLSDFIDIPEFIIEKVKRKTISLTHYSDIIRMGLLSRYGGIWIDSTVYVSRPILSFKTSFFSIKQHRYYKRYVAGGNLWTAFLIGVSSQNCIPKFVYNLFLEYWKLNDSLIDYYFIDYALSIAYENMETMQKSIQKNSFVYEDVYYLASIWNKKYKGLPEKNIVNSPFSKLNWRQKTKKNSLGDYIINASST